MPNASELRELDDEELESRLAEYRREMLNLRFQLATGQLDNFVRISVVRKDVGPGAHDPARSGDRAGRGS